MPDTLSSEKLAQNSGINGIIERPGFMPLVLISHLAAQEKLEGVSAKDLHLFSYFPEIMRSLWLADKPNMERVNQDNELIFRLLLGEIQEALEEHEKMGSEDFSPEKKQAEFVDAMIFLSTMALNGAQEPFTEIRYFSHLQLAKLADSSKVYERMKLLAADILATNNRQAFEEFFKLGISLTANFSTEFNFSQVFNAVLEKNRRNYPAEYFQDLDSLTGQKLSIEDQILKFHHVKRCLKFLRYHPTGNLIEQHQFFSAMIHQFRASDEAFRQLEEAVERMILKEGVDYSVARSGILVANSSL